MPELKFENIKLKPVPPRAGPKKMHAVLLKETTKDNAEVPALKVADIGFFTGEMGYCVAAILYWKRATSGGYMEGRGQHASGGPEAVNFEKLFADVQQIEHHAKLIFVVPQLRLQEYKPKIATACQAAGVTLTQNIIIGGDNFVDRWGNTQKATNLDMSQFKCRYGDWQYYRDYPFTR